MKECFNCGFWDSEREGCTCPSIDKWYACPIESEKPENKQALEEFANWKPDGEVGWKEVRRMIRENDYIAEYVKEKYPKLLGLDFAMWKIPKVLSKSIKDMANAFKRMNDEGEGDVEE